MIPYEGVWWRNHRKLYFPQSKIIDFIDNFKPSIFFNYYLLFILLILIQYYWLIDDDVYRFLQKLKTRINYRLYFALSLLLENRYWWDKISELSIRFGGHVLWLWFHGKIIEICCANLRFIFRLETFGIHSFE